MSKEDFKLDLSNGIIPAIQNYPTVKVEYNPDKFWKENTIESIFKDLIEMDRIRKEQIEKSGWKPQYMITPGEAATASLDYLIWLCEKYAVVGGFEAVTIMRQRQIILQRPANVRATNK